MISSAWMCEQAKCMLRLPSQLDSESWASSWQLTPLEFRDQADESLYSQLHLPRSAEIDVTGRFVLLNYSEYSSVGSYMWRSGTIVL